jgi:hypothetical protein
MPIKIEFKVEKIVDCSIPAIGFEIEGEKIEIVEKGQQGLIYIESFPFYGFFIIELKEDMPYKIQIYVISEEGYFPVESNYIYLNVVKRNAELITEKQFEHFNQKYYEEKRNKQLSEKAIEILNNVKAKGLKIALENWPHAEPFSPVENSQGLKPIIINEDPYEIALINEALINPNYKDNVTVEINPPQGDYKYFADIDTSPEPLPPPQSIGINKFIKIHFTATWQHQCFPENNIDVFNYYLAGLEFNLKTFLWVKRKISPGGTTVVEKKPVAYKFQLDTPNLYCSCGIYKTDTSECMADSTNIIAYAADEPFPIVEVWANIGDENITLGECNESEPCEGMPEQACPVFSYQVTKSTLTEYGEPTEQLWSHQIIEFKTGTYDPYLNW